MRISKKFLLSILIFFQILVFADVILSLAGRTSILTDYVRVGSLITLMLCPVAITVLCVFVFLRLYSGTYVSRFLMVTAFLVVQFATMGVLYQSMALQSFDEAKNVVVTFLRTSSPKATYAKGIGEKDVYALRGTRVDLIAFQSLKRYRAYEFLVKPAIGRVFVVQLRGDSKSRQIYVYIADAHFLSLPRSGTLEEFEKAAIDVYL